MNNLMNNQYEKQFIKRDEKQFIKREGPIDRSTASGLVSIAIPPKECKKILERLEHLNETVSNTSQRLSALEERLQPIIYPIDSDVLKPSEVCSPVLVMNRLELAIENLDIINKRIENLITNCFL